MAKNIEYLESLPDIDILADEGITLEAILQEIREDYEEAYEEATGEEKILYPADPVRLMLNVCAGQIYQVYELAQELFKQNFIRYMNDDLLLHWGSNLGYERPDATAATTELEFGLEEVLTFDVVVPEGTRATAGDDIFFATVSEAVIPAGESSVLVTGICTESGKLGNDYAVGQISTIADPFPYMGYVNNLTVSSGGTDVLSGDDLREAVYIYPSTYSVAGPIGAYIARVKEYSSGIEDVSVITTLDAVVHIYLILEDGKLPDTEFLEKVREYLENAGLTPDTDKVLIEAPEVVWYEVSATYFIDSDNKDNVAAIKEAVHEAVDYFVEMQYSEIGKDIDSGGLIELMRVAGAKRVVIDAPDYVKLTDAQVSMCSNVSLIYGGLEE